MTINLKLPTSWRTTLVGVAAAFYAAWNGFGDGSISMAIHDPRVQLAVFAAALGYLAKDSQVTGGTVGQPSTPKALDAANQAHSTTNVPITPGK
jgi:hypothetical protein